MISDRATERARILWLSDLAGDTGILEPKVRATRRLFGRLPSPPRCKVCLAPFRGLGGIAAKAFGFGAGASRFNPTLCDRCEKIVQAHQVGAEVELTLLFAESAGRRRSPSGSGRPSSTGLSTASTG